MIKKGILLSLALAATVLLAGCADTSTQDKSDPKPPQTTAAPTTAPETAPSETVADNNDVPETEAPAPDDSDTEAKTITKEQAEAIALEKMGDNDKYIATYQDMVQYNGEDYFLINVRWKVDDGNGKSHYSHCGYIIVSMDGTDVKSADYVGGTVQVYQDL